MHVSLTLDTFKSQQLNFFLSYEGRIVLETFWKPLSIIFFATYQTS